VAGDQLSQGRSASQTSNGGRPLRHTREELRALLLEAGREILSEEGLQSGSVNLTFKRVFDRVESTTGLQVTNASVIKRIWDNQADFQADVLMMIANDTSRPEVDRTFAALISLLDGADLSTPESRSWLVQQVCRVGANANSVAIAESTNFSLWMSVVASATTAPADQQPRLQRAILEGYEAAAKFWEGAFGALSEIVGMRIRSPWTFSQFVTSVTALTEGFSIRQRLEGHEWVSRPTGRNGEEQEWTLFAVALEALVHQFFEPDPAFGAR